MSGSIRTLSNPCLSLPKELEGLAKLSANLYWAWHDDAKSVLRDIDPERFDNGASPVQIIRESARLAEFASNDDYVRCVESAVKHMEAYLADLPKETYGVPTDHPIAYFCAEYGLHESFAQYCGGLGILAGDHCKEASDMGLPFVGIGCFYKLGFFRQLLDRFGKQVHTYPEFDPHNHCLERVLVPATSLPLTVSIDFPGRTVFIAVWKVQVGRVPLLLLDSDLPENSRFDRPITSQLYMIGRRMRFYQESVLGIGGVRVLNALGIKPSVFHMNEGHSALLLVERLKEAVESGLSWPDAVNNVKSRSVLTIHTPVPAGNERFDAKLVREILGPTVEGSGLDLRQIMKLGLDSVADKKVFDMTAFGLRLSKAANGVSILHGQTANGTWEHVVGLPIGAVTNGVHMPTWVGPEIQALYRSAGAPFSQFELPNLTERKSNRPVWEGIDQVKDSELWNAHQAQKDRMAKFVGERLVQQHARYGESPEELEALSNIINPDAFIIGFARRFTGYKRPNLILSQAKKLLALLGDAGRPVQIVFAGKAHPLDEDGQRTLAELYLQTQSPKLRGKVVLLEEYDMQVGRMLTQGVDLWINNPLRPLEASGTSGMKAAANAVPNASILDGWWDEGYEGGKGKNGFAVGAREPQKTRRLQDKYDSDELYRVLLEEVLSLYWMRGKGGLPVEWIMVMKRSIATSFYAFSTRRMLIDYCEMYR